MIRRFAFVIAVIAVALGTGSAPALAHKMKIFASATGATILGYAYFNADSRAVQTRVTVLGADGSTVFTGVTDDKGQFAVQATRRMDHHISVIGEDGHMATFTVTAAELPESLPPAEGSGAAPATAAAVPAATAAAAVGSDDLRNFIDQSVSRQLRPLREQIDAYQEKIWLHDVIGGIGYIVGVAGLAFGFANRRRRPQVTEPS